MKWQSIKVKGNSNKMAYIFVVIGVILVLVVAWFLVGCSRVPPKSVIDIDKLLDAEPEMCNQQLTEKAAYRLSQTDYRQEGIDDAKGMTGNVATMTYEKVRGIVNKSGSYPRIVIGFNAEQHSENITVYFGEYVDKMEALRRVGFEEKDLFDSGYAPYRLETYTQKSIYLIYENADFAGGIFAAPSVEWKKRYWISWEQFDDGRTTGINVRLWAGTPAR